MSYRHIEVSPISGALGAEIAGVNLAQSLSDDTFEEVHRAFLDNLVIFFRGQDMTPDQQKNFACRFGELDVHEYVEGMADHPEIIRVVKEADDGGYNFGGRWHSDVTYQERPALGSVLYAREVPPYGGDTLFANQYLAYEQLSPGMKRMLEPLRAVHTAANAYGPNGNAARMQAEASGYASNMKVNPDLKAEAEVSHPVVCTHPETGRKYLYVNKVYTEYLEGLTREESEGLLEFLFDHATQEPFTCRFRWEVGSVAFWDNRVVQHFALNDYTGFRREMHRATIQGQRPA